MRYCIYCGRTGTPDNPVVNGVCLECRRRRGELDVLTRDSVEAEVCRICYAVRLGGRWIDTKGLGDAAARVAEHFFDKIVRPGPGVEGLRLIGVEYVTKPSWRTVMRYHVEGVYGGAVFRESIDITVFLRPSKCPRCVMYDSREFEAVLQVRGIDKEMLNDVLSGIFMGDPKASRDLIDVIETRDGVDLYFYTHGAARRVSRMLLRKISGLGMKETYEETGMRSGKHRARLYIVVRPR